MAKAIEGYCAKCRARRPMKKVEAVTMSDGRPATRGVCGVCGSKMFKVGSSKAAATTSAPKAAPGKATAKGATAAKATPPKATTAKAAAPAKTTAKSTPAKPAAKATGAKATTSKAVPSKSTGAKAAAGQKGGKKK